MLPADRARITKRTTLLTIATVGETPWQLLRMWLWSSQRIDHIAGRDGGMTCMHACMIPVTQHAEGHPEAHTCMYD